MLSVIINTKPHNVVQFVFKSTCFSGKQNYSYKFRLFSFLNTKQTNDGGENFNEAKNFLECESPTLMARVIHVLIISTQKYSQSDWLMRIEYFLYFS